MTAQSLWRTLGRTVLLAAGVLVGLWFLHTASGALVLFATAFILAIPLNAAVTWLEVHRVPRWGGIPLVLVSVLAALALIGWLIVPRLVNEIRTLADEAPTYAERLDAGLSDLLGPVPGIEGEDVDPSRLVQDALPSVGDAIGRIGAVSLSVFGALAIGIVLISVILFALISPRPLLRAYLEIFPPTARDRAERAFTQGAIGVVGWIRSNLIVGSIEAVVVGIVLGLLGVPGAIVWAALAFFAELIPRIGIYLMAVPPVLVSLAVDPLLAAAVAVFYLVMSQVAGNVLSPALRAKTMNLHPVALMFMVLALASLFGLVGALIATPLTAFAKGFYTEFYLGRRQGADGAGLDERVERMMAQDAGPSEVVELGEAPAERQLST
jgi:predicted PurR-regulated permease PerM